MFETDLSRMDELNRCHDRSWSPIGEEKRFDLANPVITGQYPGDLKEIEPQFTKAHNEGLVHIGQKVFLADEQFVGLTTKLFLGPNRRVSHLAIRTARLLGRHKMLPIALVSEVNALRILLSVNEEQFKELPEYKEDSTILEDVDRALWNDLVLRDTDYRQIDVQVRDGVITLHGHVITSMNQWRAETAVKNIPGILGLKSYVIPDDKLALIVAEVLGQIEQRDDCRFLSKVEHGLVVLSGVACNLSIRDQAEQSVADIPWVRGIINKISIPGMVIDPGDQRFLQPLIAKELIFKDSLSVTILKVVINPHNRRVTELVALGRFPDPKRQKQYSYNHSENIPERLMVIPIAVILYLTGSASFCQINSDETEQYKDYDPSLYIAPDKGWLPPYPYCIDEVLFKIEKQEPPRQV